MAKVKGTLTHDCYAAGRLCKAGEEVEVSEELTEYFFGKRNETAKEPKEEKAKKD